MKYFTFLQMPTKKTQLAFYAQSVVYDWLVHSMEKWEITSLSKAVNYALLIMLLLERHKMLDPILNELARKEGFSHKYHFLDQHGKIFKERK